ncbi:unnamed protein product [Clonostachys rosea f. rosea IK726]|uniref:Uncharacterized protein n=1 Tax=Clonostachys rosea f. rosea IK726 TaxID=1349383 RepID=A0ACA9U5C9_BIOOC|nr:unnamed protein product [Clonostachys rosea f. rosea IK726]
MSCVDPPIHLNDDSLALQIQLEEVQGQREHQSGKWVEGNPPDYAIAFEMFENEVNGAIALVQDMRLAHSIAMAVDSDALAIELLTAEEASIAQDRAYALSLDEDGGAARLNNTNTLDVLSPKGEVIDWDFVFDSATPVVESWATSSTVAGPSGQYVHHQQAALQGLPNIKVECFVCGDNVPPGVSVRLACEDIYCKPCLKDFFLRVAKDESLFPPRCHRQPIDLSIVEPNLSIDELNMYKEAEAEFTKSTVLFQSVQSIFQRCNETRITHLVELAVLKPACIAKLWLTKGPVQMMRLGKASLSLEKSKAGNPALDVAKWSIDMKGVIT